MKDTNFFNVYLFLIEREHEQGRGRERVQRENPKQSAHYQRRAGLELTNPEIMT